MVVRMLHLPLPVWPDASKWESNFTFCQTAVFVSGKKTLMIRERYTQTFSLHPDALQLCSVFLCPFLSPQSAAKALLSPVKELQLREIQRYIVLHGNLTAVSVRRLRHCLLLTPTRMWTHFLCVAFPSKNTYWLYSKQVCFNGCLLDRSILTCWQLFQG